MTKQTAVEWLQVQLNEFSLIKPSLAKGFAILVHQAKEMEKKQIKDAFFIGYEYCRERELECQGDDFEIDYFNETFNNQTP